MSMVSWFHRFLGVYGFIGALKYIQGLKVKKKGHIERDVMRLYLG